MISTGWLATWQDGLAQPSLERGKKAYLIGTAAPAFATRLSGICPTAICHDLEQATRAAFNDASADPEGGTILLAPAAASFDQFSNFGERGDAFAALANDLCAKGYADPNATARRRDNHA